MLTVVIDTPTGEKRGSGPVEVKRWLNHFVPGRGSVAAGSFRGEATVVEVAPGRYLFALLKGSHYGADNPLYIATHTFESDLTKYRGANLTWSRLSELRGIRSVPSKYLPIFVTFEDIDLPASVKRVDPNDLEATFGEGFAIREVSLKLSNAPMDSHLIAALLPCLNSGNALTCL